MDKLVDYTKYTLALAVGLFLYIPANFIPIDVVWKFWVLMGVLCALVISIAAGLLLYSRATKLLVENPDVKQDARGWIKLWGNLHLWLLLAAFLATTPYYFAIKIWSPSSTIECKIAVPAADGKEFDMTFPCTVK